MTGPAAPQGVAQAWLRQHLGPLQLRLCCLEHGYLARSPPQDPRSEVPLPPTGLSWVTDLPGLLLVQDR